MYRIVINKENMEIKTAEDYLIEIDRIHGDDTVHATKEEIIDIMVDFSKQFIDLAADKAKTNFTYDTNEGGIVDAQIDKQSILDIKQLIK